MGASELWQPNVILYIVSGFFAMLSFACVSGASYEENGGSCNLKFDNLDNICGGGVGDKLWKSSAGFLVAVGIMMFLNSIVMFLFHVVFPSKQPLRFPLIELCVDGLLTFFMVIAASAFAKVIADVSDDIVIKVGFNTSFTTWRAGDAFGFLAFFCYVALLILAAMKASRGTGAPSGNAPV